MENEAINKNTNQISGNISDNKGNLPPQNENEIRGKVIEPNDFCPFFYSRVYPTPSNKCWFCIYGDFSESLGKISKKGVCRCK